MELSRNVQSKNPLPASEHIVLPKPNTIFQFFILHSSLLLIRLGAVTLRQM